MIVTIGLVLSGRPSFRFMLSIEAAVISASVTMPQGTPVAATGEAVGKLGGGRGAVSSSSRWRSRARDYVVDVLAAVGDQPMAGRGGGPDGPPVGSSSSSNVGEVAIELLPTEQRIYGSEQLDLMWRDATGPIPEAVDVQLGGPNLDRLRCGRRGRQAAAAGVCRRLRGDRLVPGRQGGDEARHQAGGGEPRPGRCRTSGGRCARRSNGEEAQRIQRDRDEHPRHGPLSARRAARSATSRTCASAPPMAARCRSTRSRWSSCQRSFKFPQVWSSKIHCCPTKST